ncbi:MAG: hypothetical protein AAB215_05065 [Planctomycetota bacterium]
MPKPPADAPEGLPEDEPIPEAPARGLPKKRADIFPILTIVLGLAFGGVGVWLLGERSKVEKGIAEVEKNQLHLQKIETDTRPMLQVYKQFVLKDELDKRWEDVKALQKKAEEGTDAAKGLETKMADLESSFVKITDFSQLKAELEEKHKEFRLRIEQVVSEIERLRKKHRKFDTFFYGTGAVTIPKGGREALQTVELVFEGKPIPFENTPSVFLAPNAVVRSDPRNPKYMAATEDVAGVSSVDKGPEGYRFQVRAFSESEQVPQDRVIEFMWFAVGDVREAP